MHFPERQHLSSAVIPARKKRIKVLAFNEDGKSSVPLLKFFSRSRADFHF
jgi:hypothetical protein